MRLRAFKTNKPYFILPLLVLFATLSGNLLLNLLSPAVAAGATKQVKTFVVTADKENCLECHTAKTKIQIDVASKEKPSTFLSPQLILETAHANLACTDCHKGHTRAMERRSISRFGKSEVKVLHSEQEYRNYTQVATEACGDPNCHKKEQEEFLAGAHSQRIAKTDKDLPTCTTCHNFHYIPRLFNDKNGKPLKISAEMKINVAVALCGSCHIEALTTYTGNYHYKALRLGNREAPMCYDCHDGHKSTPLQSGTPEAVQNCKKCHDKASKDFTKYIVHLDPVALTAPPEVLYTNFFYTVLIVLIMSMVTLHTLIQGSRKRKERRAEEQKEWERLLKEQEQQEAQDDEDQ